MFCFSLPGITRLGYPLVESDRAFAERAVHLAVKGMSSAAYTYSKSYLRTLAAHLIVTGHALREQKAGVKLPYYDIAKWALDHMFSYNRADFQHPEIAIPHWIRGVRNLMQWCHEGDMEEQNRILEVKHKPLKPLKFTTDEQLDLNAALEELEHAEGAGDEATHPSFQDRLNSFDVEEK